MKHQSAAVQVSDLRLKFPGEPSFIFKDLSLSIPKGEKVLLLGPSGSGKSTLLQVLSGIIPHSLEVPFKYDKITLPSSWGFVFQDPDTQFCMPFVDEELAFVLENLNVPREQMAPLMTQALATVGLQFDDLHTEIHTLSQGMKQRLALASVLLLEPDVLFLDEPSAMLDPEGTSLIWDTVKRISDTKTVIIVEHKIEHVTGWIDRVVLFNSTGTIIADGVPEKVFTHHMEEINTYGIWYPDVWQDYIENDTYQQMMQNRHLERMTRRVKQTPSVSLHNFRGFRDETERIYVPQAETLPGEWIVIRGANGAGKSTLLLSLMQLLRTTGDYHIQEEAIKHRTKRKWLKKGKRSEAINKLAFVFQNPELQFVTNSIYEEVAFTLNLAAWPSAKIEHKVKQMLESFGLNMDEQRHPYQLSIGQKRRLSVASAIVKEQPIILLDEPTFGLDAKNTFAMLESLENQRSQGTTIIMVTHDLNIITYFSNKIWDITLGKLTEITPTETSNQKQREVQDHEFIHTP